ncbi:hypothetical protein SM139_3947, partial [Stenotrophomonas maltophilia]
RLAELPLAPRLAVGCVAVRDAAQPREECGGRRLFVGFGECIFQRFGGGSGQLQAGQCSAEQCLQAWIGGVGRVHGGNLTRQGHLRRARWRAVRVGVPVKIETKKSRRITRIPTHRPPWASRCIVAIAAEAATRSFRCLIQDANPGQRRRRRRRQPSRVLRGNDMGKVAIY